MSGGYDMVVGIPAHCERARIGACLEALCRQTGVPRAHYAIVVAVHDSPDGTGELVRAIAARSDVAIHVVERDWGSGRGHVGRARGLAMREAARLCRPDGLLLTTDADGRAAPDWLWRMRRAFEGPAAAVAGRIVADPSELARLAPGSLAMGRLEGRALALAAQVESLLDPRPGDPWPRHVSWCGGNLGVRRGWFERVGGVPPLPSGEDRALMAAIEARDGLIRHALDCVVTVSARLDGRARGGMADALLAREAGAGLCDSHLELPGDFLRRARLRGEARAAWAAGRFRAWLAASGLGAGKAAAAASHAPWFGTAWAALEAGEPMLARRRLSADGLEGFCAELEAWLDAAPAALDAEAA